ncbi:MAG TPA: ATP-grasp domain-containing protein [Vicinamibacteria bacterium]|nr:ATP-grasp domain-containing protein [Vicinamibacteria bacterium]
MPRKTVAVLYDVWWPHDHHGLPFVGDGSEPPEVHEEVYCALKAVGYRPVYVVLDGATERLTRLARTPASAFFNLTESYGGDDTKDLHVAAYLELLGKRYTGNGPRALHVGQDKVLAKKLLRFHGVETPDFAAVGAGARNPRVDLRFPLIVKPSREDGSIGIDTGSVVHETRALRDRIRYVQRAFGTVLVERYVPGRDIYVGVIGNDPPEPLPLVEVDLSRLPRGVPRIAGTEVKWWKGTELYRSTPAVFPSDLSPRLTRRMQNVAVEAYVALGLRDYGRVDLRLGDDGTIYVLEVNPNPWLSSQCELIMAWTKTGRSYEDLIGHLVELALSRDR